MNPGAIALSRLNQGKILEVNNTWLKLFGFSRQDIIGSDWGVVWTNSEDLTRANQELLDKGNVRNLKCLFVNKKGEQLIYEFSAEVLTIDGEEWVMATWLDSNNDFSASESEERFRALMSNNPSLIFLKDGLGRYVYLNEAYEKQFIGSKDWYGKTDFDFWPHESAELFRFNDAEVIKSGGLQQFLEDSTDMDGKRYCWLCYKFPFTDSKGRQYVGGIGIDATERVRIEEELIRSNKKISEILESIQDGFYALNREWKFTYANQRTANLLGFSPEYMIGKVIWELLPETIGSEHETGYRKAMEGEVQYFEMQGVRHTDKWFSAAVFPSDEGISVFWRDITERKSMEQTLRESEEEYRLIVEKAPTGIYEIDFRGPRFKNVNDAMCLSLGYSREELLKLSPLNILDEESKEKFKQRIGKILADKPVEESVSYTVLTRDGRKILAELAIKIKNPMTALVVARDVTERKRAEDALQASEEKFSKAFRNSPNAITITRLSDGRIIEGNESAYELFGYTHEEVLGKTTVELNIWANVSDRQRLIEGLASKGFIQNEECVLQKKDKTLINVNLSASLITIDNQQCFLCSFIDITERKLAEEALRKIKSELEIRVQERTSELSRVAEELRFSEEAYRLLVEFNPVGVFRHMYDPVAKESRRLHCNEAQLIILGYSSLDEYLKNVPTQTMRYTEDWNNYLEILLTKGKIINYPVQMKKTDGSIIWVLLNANARAHNGYILVEGAMTDITAQKKTEQRLRKAQKNLRAMASEIVMADERSRQHFATDLHDTVVQTMGAAK